jgi:hypothetical protein
MSREGKKYKISAAVKGRVFEPNMEKTGFFYFIIFNSSDYKVSCICDRDVLFFSADSKDPWQQATGIFCSAQTCEGLH